jgi:Flp pilus assembly protein TadG
MQRARQCTAGRRGATTVELAFCLPILLAVVLGIMEFSRSLQIQQTVRQAAFEGARAGIALDASATDVTNAANAIAGTVSVKNPTITIVPSTLTSTSPTISVTVSTSPANNGWFLWFLNKNSTISATVTLNREAQSISVPFSGS